MGAIAIEFYFGLWLSGKWNWMDFYTWSQSGIMELILGRVARQVDGKMYLNIKQCMVCINELQLLDWILQFGILVKGQINAQIKIVLELM